MLMSQWFRSGGVGYLWIGSLLILHLASVSLAQNSNIRLVNGTRNSNGRLEVRHNGTWGTVCDDNFDNHAATVVCRMLGYTGNLFVAREKAQFGAGTGQIWLDDTTCQGNETSLFSCRTNPWGQNNCGHDEDVGVDCDPNRDAQVTLRLVNGSNGNEGRVEVQHGVNGLWGTICDDEWDEKAALIVCQQITKRSQNSITAIPLTGAFFGQGQGNIWLDDVKCTGLEAGLGACAHKPWGQSNCQHNEDAGVMCLPKSGPNPNVTVQLTGGLSIFQGRVELRVFNHWGTICDDGFDDREATVICRMLGHHRGGRVIKGGSFGGGSGPIWLDDLECNGTESRIQDCVHKPWGSNNCGHNEDAAVMCIQDSPPNIKVRLAGSTNANEGRVEVQYNGMWGTVCDDIWSPSDAAVVCRMLGLPLYDVYHTLLCPCLSAPQHPNVTVRLVGGASSSEGRVEVYHNNQWGTVCDDYFDTKAASVVCAMLGLPSTGAQPRPKSYYGPGNGTIWLDNLRCTGNESSIEFCRHNNWGVSNCGHSEDVGVLCDTAANNVRVRLVGGSSTSNGRVEVFYNNTWGTVCDDGFSVNDAKVVCRMLGFQTANSLPVSGGHYGNGTGPILLDDVQCLGSENNLVQCRNKGWYSNNCNHGEDVGVVCNAAAARYRLVNGTNLNNGRVEVYLAGQWGTVCDDHFDVKAARVICKSLHRPYQNAVPAGAGSYGFGTGTIWLDDVTCFGNETTLMQCDTSAPGDTDCTHKEDVGVICRDSAPSTNLQYRLRGGPGNNEGRLEVNYAGRWGTVCDDSFDNKAAKIVCDTLNVTYVKAVLGKSGKYGPGVGPIWLDDVRCAGNESSLTQCSHSDFGVTDCDHTEDVGIVCATAVQLKLGPLRLRNGTTTRNGRLEVKNNGVWGTVCDDGFGLAEAQVACRELGIPTAVAVPLSNAYYGAGTGPIYVDEINCIGNETNIGQCDRKPLGVNDCGHDEDAGLMCLAHAPTSGISIRLAGGLSRRSGRVEIRYQGVWGSICDDSWDDRDATVICKQIGYSSGTALKSIGTGRGPIWMDDVECVGTESNIANCPFKGWAENDCDHSEDAGVNCNDTTVQNYKVRLANGPSTIEGRVEVFVGGNWGPVCDDSWTNADAQVVCRMLGATTDGATAYGRAKYGQSNSSFVLDQVNCVGTETNLGQCPSNPPLLHNCNHGEEAGVMCRGGQVTSLQVRLVGGSNSNEGRVEVRYNGTWGTVCDDNWNIHDAQVVCSMLQFPAQTARPRMGGFFGQGTGQIWLDDVNCIGNETSLALCGHASWGTNNCGHSEDAGVVCGGVTRTSPIRLANGTTRAEGRVEIFHNGTWGTICDDQVDRNFAQVICRQLGYPIDNVAMRKEAFFGPGKGQIWLDDVTCQGDESVLDNCVYANWGVNNCGHNEDVSVICQVPTVQIRLVPPPGGAANQGRIEVYYNNTWGTVCDDGFDSKAAGVVCGMLGFSRLGAVVKGGAFFQQGSGPILLDDLHCLGQETNILQCDAKGWGRNNCGHDEDVGVICQTSSLSTVRLVGGSSQYTGRVEVLYNGTWGTVCDDYFTNKAAKVVCSMLHYPSAGAYKVTRGGWSNPPTKIWLDNLVCTGNESSIANCRHNNWGSNNCGHNEDIGVFCTATTTPATTPTTRLPPSTPSPSSVFVRLVGGSNAYDGRVEVYAFNQWGTVCDDQWNSSSANVVCGMLGYQRTGAAARSSAYFGQGSGQIWLDNVHCHGNERSIATCPANAWGAHNCGHQEDAGISCATDSLPDGFLLFTDSSQKQIYRMDLTTQSYVTIPLSGHDKPIAIDYDYIDGRIYWTDVGIKQIRSASINGNSEKTVLILDSDSVPDGIAVDSKSRLIFYTDTGKNKIYVVTLDGSASAEIINSDLDQPRAITADPNKAKLYWSDWGHQPKIETSNYDGSNRRIIVQNDLTWPNAIAVDNKAGILYWADGSKNRIEKANLDGSNRVVLHRDIQAHYFGLALYMNTLYYTDWQQGTVMSLPTSGGSSTRFGPPGFRRLNDIHVHKNGYNPSGINGCTNGNGGCSHICLPNIGGGRTCMCSTGMSLQPDGISCGNSNPCQALPALTGGTISPASCTSGMSQPGQVCTVTCNQGYRFSGNTKLKCFGSGQWSNNGYPVTCKDITPPTVTCPGDQTLIVPQGQQTIKATWPKVTASDNSGVTPNLFQSMQSGMTLAEGVYSVTAMATDKIGLTSTCSFKVTVKVYRCPARTAPQNGYILSGFCPDYYGAHCMLACNPGYQLSDPTHNGQITCNLDANNRPLWDGVGLSCQALTCPKLTAPKNAMLSGCTAPYKFAAMCQQQCQSGFYRTQGTDTRMCMRDGTWSGQSIICSNNAVGGAQALSGSAPSSGGSQSNVGITAAVVVGVVFIVLILGGIFVYLKRMQMQASMGSGVYQMENMSTSLSASKKQGSGATGTAGWENPNYDNMDADA
ncbi:deleted in malignant brain tumors 1 protein-like [Mercenaria mercenaria]|uniref:deleted in malignant brain tumors 1 protein-like n=1 Tax=Mercenaria mercenaria TaxID=6596 RepID=UPI00234ED49C|nr:deleted in malignant brain tumors 1 protein-like [Mercenaria mercenaria]